MINIQNLHFGYRKNKVFDNVSATMEPGHIYGILGKNGTGKSTLLYSIAGLLFPQDGKIEVMGFKPHKRQSDFLKNIFIIPEEFYLPDIPVQKFIRYYSPFYPRFKEGTFWSYIREFEIPEDSTLLTMSYGQKKKVLISFGLATNVPVLLMDEPTNGLDIVSKSQLKRIIAGAMDEQKCILVSSHQVKDLENLIDEVIILNETKIILKERLDTIGRKLSFRISFEHRDLEHALYSEPMLRGNTIVSVNKMDDETKIDLELLYKATMADPEKMQAALID
ncbi:MAG TPA: ATP-binding cassette domain-containing protein [Chryseolinea sp.]|nr:ATP-binding cassette domain-containing protein [Chryseolinea sp.]